jgi:hypothetical protein
MWTYEWGLANSFSGFKCKKQNIQSGLEAKYLNFSTTEKLTPNATKTRMDGGYWRRKVGEISWRQFRATYNSG